MTQDLDQQGHAATAARRKHPFDVDAFLAKPLVARVATSGPAVRPVWYLWEDGAFWWITGCYARLPELLAEDPRVALVVDTCDLKTLEVLQVTARGEAEVVPFDEARARRKLVRYLGDDEHTWPSDFREFGPDTRFVRFVPNRLIAIDLSKVRPLSRDGVEEGSASVGIVDADGTRSVRARRAIVVVPPAYRADRALTAQAVLDPAVRKSGLSRRTVQVCAPCCC